MIDRRRYDFYRKIFPILGKLKLVLPHVIEVNVDVPDNSVGWYMRGILYTTPYDINDV